MEQRIDIVGGDDYRGDLALCFTCDQPWGDVFLVYGEQRVAGTVDGGIARFEFTAQGDGGLPFAVEGVTMNGKPIYGTVHIASRACT